MANKKITELQLRSSVTADLNLPGDDGLQTYRVTAAQIKDFILAAGNVGLSALAVDILNGLSAVSAADDDYFPLIDTSDSNKTKKALVSTFVRQLYRSVSSFPATVTSTDGSLKLSGASGTITLPATGNAGKRYTLIHAGTSISQVYTIATTGGATIGGVASGSYKLCTNRESLTLEDDGTDWQIVSHYAKTPLATEAHTIGAVTTAPVKGTTAIDRVEWFRDGQFLDATYRYKQTALGSATAGNGHYLFSLPASLSADSTWVPFSTQSSIDHIDNYPAAVGIGVGWDGGPSTKTTVHALMYNATQFRMISNVVSGSPAWKSSTNWGLNQTSDSWVVKVRVPIADWRP